MGDAMRWWLSGNAAGNEHAILKGLRLSYRALHHRFISFSFRYPQLMVFDALRSQAD